VTYKEGSIHESIRQDAEGSNGLVELVFSFVGGGVVVVVVAWGVFYTVQK